MEALESVRGAHPLRSTWPTSPARVDPRQINRMQIENLAKAGAFDTARRQSPPRVYAGAETVLRRAQADGGGEGQRRRSAFSGHPAGDARRCACRTVADWMPMDRLGFEAEAIGFHLTAHPLDAYAQVLRRLGVVSSTQMESLAQAGSARVKLAGSVIASKERITQKGSRMAWVRLSDAGGSYEVTVFSEVLSRSREALAAGNAVLVTAELRMEGEALRVTANDVVPLDEAAAQAGAGMRVWLDRTEALPHIRALLTREGTGRGEVVLMPRMESDEEEVEITLPGRFNVTPRLAQAMRVLPGVSRIEDL